MQPLRPLRFWASLGLGLLLACDKKAALPISDFYGFADIASFELKVPRPAYYLQEDSLLAVQVMAYDAEKRRVAVPDSAYEFFVNDRPVPRNKLYFSEEGPQMVRVRLGEKQSEALRVAAVFRVKTLRLTVDRPRYALDLDEAPLLLGVEALDDAGEPLADLRADRVEFFADGKKLPGNRYLPTQAGQATLTARYRYAASEAVVVEAFNRVSALRLRPDRATFALEFDTRPIALTTEALDADQQVVAALAPDRVVYTANGQPLAGAEITPTQPGRLAVRAKFKTVESAPVELTVLSPAEAIGAVKLELQERSGTPFLTADGQSKLRFDVRLTGRDGQALQPRTPPVLRANGQALGPDYAFQATSPGTYRLAADAYGRESNALEVKVRPAETYPVVRMPVVIHVINLPNFKPAEGSYQDVIDRVNANYRRRAAPLAAADDPTWSDTFIEFELARADPFGNAMPNPGVDVVTGPQASYSQEELRNFVFNTCYWNPNEYLNVFVFNCTNCQGIGGYAYYPTLVDNVNFREADRGTRQPYYAFGTFMMGNLHSAVLTHEWGHNLNLWHVFNGDGINGVYPNACASDPDLCEDTPYYNRGEQPASLPPYGRVSCFGQRYFSTNFMDYSPWPQAFSYDQRRRMRRAIDQALWLPTPANRRRSGRAGLPGILQPNRAPEHDPRRWVACPLPPPTGPDSLGVPSWTFTAGRP